MKRANGPPQLDEMPSSSSASSTARIESMRRDQSQTLLRMVEKAQVDEQARLDRLRRTSSKTQRGRLEKSFVGMRKSAADFINQAVSDHAILLKRAMERKGGGSAAVASGSRSAGAKRSGGGGGGGGSTTARRQLASTSAQVAAMKEQLSREEQLSSRALLSARHNAATRGGGGGGGGNSVRSSARGTGRLAGAGAAGGTARALLREKQQLLRELHSVIGQEQQLLQQQVEAGSETSSQRSCRSLHPSAWGSEVSSCSESDGSLTARSTASTFRSQMWGAPLARPPVLPDAVPGLRLRSSQSKTR